MTERETLQSTAGEFADCDSEPIHLPGGIQPHGILLALRDSDLAVLQVSTNAAQWFGAAAMKARSIEEFLGPENVIRIADGLRRTPVQGPAYLGTVSGTAQSGRFHVVAHFHDGIVILELERIESGEEPTLRELFPMLRSTRNALRAATTVEELCRSAAREIRELTGFDRVLVYKFDESWNGHVIAEDQRTGLPSYLDLWFPASDIPAQARELYRINPIRVIVDAHEAAVPVTPEINPATGRPLDMTFATWRAVAPVHAEYMRNMGIAASMSISVLRAGRLWGLITCHHTVPRAAPLEVRIACDLIAQAFSCQLTTLEGMAEFEHRMRLRMAVSRLLTGMAQEDDFVDGLAKHPDALMGAMKADGAAVLFDGHCTLLGNTPPEEQVMSIAEWLVEQGRPEVFHTNCLSELMPGLNGIRRQASGLLAISISKLHRSYVLWFRPEVVRTVKWGGDPSKLPGGNGSDPMRLHPRKSFEEWKQIVKGRSTAWKPAEVDMAAELRNSIVGIVLRNAEELAGLSAELRRSNTELEAFSYSVSHDLRAPFRHIAGYAELLREHLGESLDARGARYIDTIVESAHSAGMLVDHLLSYSRIGRAKLYRSRVNMKRLVEAVIREVVLDHKDRSFDWRVGELPPVDADASMMRLVVTNLLSNAVKYTRGRDPAVIEIGAQLTESEAIFCVRDNGVGFDQRYVDKLFGVFQRLHKEEDYEGSGIGLANVRRIVARHGGRTWAEGVPGSGASIWFSLPLEPSELA